MIPFFSFIERLDKDPLKTYYQVRLGEIPSVASVSVYSHTFSRKSCDTDVGLLSS